MTTPLKRSPFKVGEFGMPQTKTISKWALASAKIAYQLLAISAEVFCRHSFGVRYIGHLVAGLLSCCLYTMVMESGVSEKGSPLLPGYLFVYLCLVLYHLVSMARRGHAGVHSQSTGIPWILRNVDAAHMTAGQFFGSFIVESGIVFVFGLIVSPFDLPLSIWLIGSGISHFVKGAIAAWKFRNRVLDALDARIEGGHISEAVRNNSSPNSTHTQATAAPVTGQPQHQQNSTLREIISNLDPALRRIISGLDSNSPQTERQANPQTPRRYHAGPLGTLPRIVSNRPRNRK